jgi:hypothetical protein
MPEQASIEVHGTDDPLAAAAVEAWNRLGRDRTPPDVIEALKRKKKSVVFRLRWGARETVVAKRCLQNITGFERAIYQDLLTHVPLRSLRSLGTFEEPGGGFGWHFLEDAGGDPFSTENEGHRTLAARWLAIMHATTAQWGAAIPLPDRGPAHYEEHLEATRDHILENLGNPALGADDRRVLRAIVALCDSLAPSWDRVARCCESMPRCLVHGDFVPKNTRVRSSQDGLSLMVFDWEVSGWGTPVADLAECSDLITYWSVVRSSWRHLDLADIRRLADCGKVFRCLAAVRWSSESLPFEWIERPMRYLRCYLAELSELIPVVAVGT